ncbi:MAG: sugar-binding domain-containing protein [Spirochaetota bacterium]
MWSKRDGSRWIRPEPFAWEVKTISRSIGYQTLYETAKMYYLDNISQEEIARKLSLSRSQISRNLKKARNLGIVEIRLNQPRETDCEELACRLKNRLELKNVLVAQLDHPAKPGDEEVISAIATTAARYLETLIPAAGIVGIGWGRTVYRTVIGIGSVSKAFNTTFIPLIGSAGQYEPQYQVNTLVDRLSEKFSGKVVFLNSPAILNSDDAVNHSRTRRNISQAERMWVLCDLAIIGLGGPVQNSPVLRSEINPELIVKLLKREAVGDILARFFDSHGEICNAEVETSIFGIDINVLQTIKTVVCLSGGEIKIKGIITAASKGFFNVLITDAWSARKILEILD